MLLEREGALARLSADLAAAREGSGRVALLSGEAGIGKSALVETFTRGSGTRVLWGACEALSTPQPLGPLRDVARGAGAVLREALAGGDRPLLFDALIEELRAPPSPTILVVEDLHWADAATLDLVRYLGRRVAFLPALVLLTYRDDELDAAGPMLRAVLGALPARHVTRLPLAPLSPGAVDALAASAGRDAAALHDVTGGNPFFVTELLAHPAGRMPGSVRDAVLGRAAALDAGARELLELASIVPRAVEASTCEAVLPGSGPAIDACIAAGLLRAEGGVLRFRHELARAAVEESIPPAAAARWHARLLRALQARPHAEAGLARQVHHAQRANDTEAVLRLAPLAAREAAQRGARREAAAHCETALRHAGALPARARAELLDAFATHAFESSQIDAAIAAREEALRLVAGAGDPSLECAIWSRHAMPLVRALRNDEADAASRRAVEIAQGCGLEPCDQARAFATESYLRMLNRDIQPAIAWGERAIGLAGGCGEGEVLAAALVSTGAATMFIDYARGRDLVGRSLEIAQGLDDGGVRAADAWVMLGTAAGELRELADARRDLERGIAFTRARDLDRLGGYMEAWLAMVLLEQGEWGAAGTVANALLDRVAAGSTNRVMALVALGRLRVRRGDPGAPVLLDEALQLAERSGTLQRIAPVRALRAEAAWLAGDLAGARAEAGAVLELARSKRHAWMVGELSYWLWRGGGRTPPADEMAAPYSLQLRGDWRGAAAEWRRRGCVYEEAAALADGDAAACAACLEVLDRLQARPMAGWVRRRLKAEGVPVPRGPRTATRANAAGLTAREMEVLRLVAKGWQNARIAQALSRSPRTVEHHLEAILAKLEAGSRGEAVEAARRRGLLAQDG